MNENMCMRYSDNTSKELVEISLRETHRCFVTPSLTIFTCPARNLLFLDYPMGLSSSPEW